MDEEEQWWGLDDPCELKSSPYMLMTSDLVEHAKRTLKPEEFEIALANCGGEPEKYCPCVFYTGSCWNNCAWHLGLV